MLRNKLTEMLINERDKVDLYRSLFVLVLLVFLISLFLILFVVVDLLLGLGWLLLVRLLLVTLLRRCRWLLDVLRLLGARHLCYWLSVVALLVLI